jgi:hypothetical protein
MTAPRRRWLRFSLRTLLALIALAAVLTFAYRQRSERIRFGQALRENLSARLESAKGAYEAVMAAHEAHNATVFDLLDAQTALAEAEVALAKNSQEEIAALQSHAQRLKLLEELIAKKYEAGHEGGEASAYRSVKRDRQSAEIEVLKAQFQAGVPRDQ